MNSPDHDTHFSDVHLPPIELGHSQLSRDNKGTRSQYTFPKKYRIKSQYDLENLRYDTNDTFASLDQPKGPMNTQATPQSNAPKLVALENTPAKIFSSSFKANGARFSLNKNVNNSPAKIFIRANRQSEDLTQKMLSEKKLKYFKQNYAPGQDKFISKNKKAEEEQEELSNIINLQKLNESEELDIEDKKVKDLIGEDAVDNYYGHYKNLTKIIQQNLFFNIQPSVQTNILSEAERRNILPSKLGIIKTEGDDELLMISHNNYFILPRNMNFGDQYSSVLSQGLSKIRSIKKYNLSHNRISEVSSALLVTTISKSAKHLNLASNNIGKAGCQHLSSSISENKQILNLEDNKLGDFAILKLLEGISKNKSLRIINLSKNFISDKVCVELKNILEYNEIFELYLHWNMIKAQGGKEIFEGLKSNEYLKVLDLSYNCLGKGNAKLSCSPQICEYIAINIELRHLDLSNNQFNLQDSQEIATALEKNKTIYGFHFSGNIGYVDSRGFLVVEEQSASSDISSHIKMRIEGCQSVENSMFRTSRDKDLKDCCWICQGWQECQFVWKQGVSGDLNTDPLFIHFNFEDFKGNFFGKDGLMNEGDSQIYKYKRMIPPGELEFFFSSEDSSEIAKDQEKKFSQEGASIPEVQIYPGLVLDVPLQELNFRSIHSNKKLFQKYDPLFQILPRTRDEVYIPPKEKKLKVKWTFPISLFAKWKQDDEEILKKCFDYDWEYGKIPKLIKKEEELAQVKEFFQSNYRLIKDCYKNYAAKYPVGDIWAIQNPAFLEFVEKIKIVDRNLIKDPDINLKWVATISSIPQQDKTNPRNPVQAISRYQMMEILVRISEEKYILKYKTTTNYFEAIKLLWEEHLQAEINTQYNLQTWRNERYWNEECDTCLKKYKGIVEHVYKKYSKQKVKPGQVPFMCLEELQAICTKAGLQEEAHFGPNVALQAFSFSMMTQVDELQQDRTYQMSMLEFYEAIARIAEAASLKGVPGTYKVQEGEEDLEWTLERRKAQILGYKIESMIARLLSHLCDASFKEKYPPMTKSFFVQEMDPDAE